MTTLISFISPLLVTVFLGCGLFYTTEASLRDIATNQISTKVSNLEFLPFRDTAFVYGDRYMILDLKTQQVTLFVRDSANRIFNISSGNPYISEGMETPTGIFTIMSKSPLAISKQFNDAKLHSWMGINGNIGFHGLDGNGYYWNLGRRPSSHGCVRISREDGKKLYGLVPLGTPIFVVKGAPVIIPAFSKENDVISASDISLAKRNPETVELMNKRIQDFYNGNQNPTRARLVLDGKTIIGTRGYANGLAEKLPPFKKPSTVVPLQFTVSLVDNLWNTSYSSHSLLTSTVEPTDSTTNKDMKSDTVINAKI
jgi:hypothetical protein